MNIKYTILVSTLVLTACGSETDSQVSTQQQKMTPPVVETKVATGNTITHVEKKVAPLVTQQKVEPITLTEEKKFELPLGRLTGIVDTGEYKQAIIDNRGQVIRLKEGDDWQGWTVTTIHPEKIAIQHNKEEHSLLLLSEFRSPQLTQTELDNQQANSQDKSLQNQSKTAEAKPFTEEQLTELRSRLLVGR